MCYLVRQQQAEAERGGAASPPSLERLRLRWLGAVLATFVGGLAVAALVAPPSTPPVSHANSLAVAAPVVFRTAGQTPVVEQTSAPVDDGVPSNSDVVKAGLGHCDHDL